MKPLDYLFNIILIIFISSFISFFYIRHYVQSYVESIPYVDVAKIINTVSDNMLSDVLNNKLSSEDALAKHNEILEYIDSIFGSSNNPVFVKQCFVHGGVDITDQVFDVLLKKGFIHEKYDLNTNNLQRR